jgi:hypothetical protein
MSIDIKPFNVLSLESGNILTTPTKVAKHGKTIENMMNGIESFFSTSERMGKLLPFLKGTSKISLRMIEWFVFVYAMKNSVGWFQNGEYFNVYLDYQNVMERHKKQLFDPMARKWRKEKRKDGSIVKMYHGINFFYTDKDYVVTSVAQLNFFRWFIGKGILNYMLEHYDTLIVEMNKHNAEKKRMKRLKMIEKNNSITTNTMSDSSESCSVRNKKIRVQAMKKVTKKNVEVYVSFD